MSPFALPLHDQTEWRFLEQTSHSAANVGWCTARSHQTATSGSGGHPAQARQGENAQTPLLSTAVGPLYVRDSAELNLPDLATVYGDDGRGIDTSPVVYPLLK